MKHFETALAEAPRPNRLSPWPYIINNRKTEKILLALGRPADQAFLMEPIEDLIQRHEESSPLARLAVGNSTLVYAMPNQICLQRVKTLTTKEPHTLAWLNDIHEGANLLDVGANVGMYTIYAGVARKARVYAFEPESQNYGTLCKNIALNNLGDRAVAWCAALSDEQKFDRIFISQFVAGGSCHSFGEAVDPFLQQKEFPFSQGCFSTTIDHLVASGTIPVPNFIKIDVDGIEHKVIRGGAETLRNPEVRSVIIELNTHLPEHNAVIDVLREAGFTHDAGQFLSAQRQEGNFKGVGECIFRR